MRRTRKWAYVEQEAKRLAALQLSPREIAERLQVWKSTVTRWIAAGKLTLPPDDRAAQRAVVTAQSQRQTPEAWAALVRQDYALDATDDQLVTMAEATLGEANDLTLTVTARNQSRARFQALVKQLALVARAEASVPPVPATLKPTLRVIRRPAGDPRRALMAASE